MNNYYYLGTLDFIQILNSSIQFNKHNLMLTIQNSDFVQQLLSYFPKKEAPIKICVAQFEAKIRESGNESGLNGIVEVQSVQKQASKEPKTNYNSVQGQVGEKDTQRENSTKIFKNVGNVSQEDQITQEPISDNQADKFKLRSANEPLVVTLADSGSGENKVEEPEETPDLDSEMMDIEPPNPARIKKVAHEDLIQTLPDLQVFFETLKENVIQDDLKFLEFVKYYQELPSTNATFRESIQKMEIRCYQKEAELEHRLTMQGVDTSKIASLQNKTFKKDDEVYGEGAKLMSKGNAMQYIDPNQSVTRDIEGLGFNDFKEASWILITNQRPGSYIPETKNSKEKDVKGASSAAKEGDGPSSVGIEKALKDAGASQETILAQFASFGGQLTKPLPSRAEGRGAGVRAATLEKNQVSQILNPQIQTVLPQKRYGHSACIIDNKMYIFGGAFRKGNGASPFHSFYECTMKFDNQRDDLFKWKKIQGESPQTRDSHSCVNFLDCLLIFGGSSDGVCFNDLYKYNVTAKIWTKIEPISDPGNQPEPREGHVGIIVQEGDKMLVHGGINDNQQCYDDAFILVGLNQQIDQLQSKIKTNESGDIINTQELKSQRGDSEMLRWFKCEQTGDIPSARDSHSGTLANNQIYIFGGQDTDENLSNEIYRVSIIQGQIKVTGVNQDGTNFDFYDRTFKLHWKKIIVRQEEPIKRSSHSMNLFMNRYLILIGGETSVENGPISLAEIENPTTSIKIKIEDVDSPVEEKPKGSCQNKPLNDVWLFDLILNEWRCIEPITKVQSSFNNKKLRKSFEPRMAHSANVYGNYIVCFGGFNSMNNQYSPANFNILSLQGCTDYILQVPYTLEMAQKEFIRQKQLLAAEESKKKKKRKTSNNNNNSSVKIQLNQEDLEQMEDISEFNESHKISIPHETTNPETTSANGRSKKGVVIPKPAPKPSKVVTKSIMLQTSSQQMDEPQVSILTNHKPLFAQIFDLAEQIKSPIQLIIEMIKGQISLYERYYQLCEREESRKQILNREDFESLDMIVQLLLYPQKDSQDVNILHFMDNGPGMSHLNLKEALSSEVPDYQRKHQDEQHFDYFKYAALKLAHHTLIITKTQQLIKNQSMVQNEVHIGMLSSSFIKDSGSPYLVAPIVSFKVEEKELIPLTPLPEKFINLILAYTGIFTKYEEIKQHIQMGMFSEDQTKFRTGTEIYLCNLRQKFHSFDQDIYLVEDFKKRESQDLAVQTQQTSTTEDLLQEDLHHSLITQIKYSYIDFPSNVNLRVNDGPIDAQNPFGSIIKYVLEDEMQVAINGQSKFYKYWIISEVKLKEMYVNDKVLSKFEGLLIYKGNEFVKKDEMCQPNRIIQQCHHNRFSTRLGKRNIQQMKQAGIKTPQLHGIIMIETEGDQSELTFDKQDLVHESFLEFIREDITQAYLDWEQGCEIENITLDSPQKDEKMLKENTMLREIIEQQEQELQRLRTQAQFQQQTQESQIQPILANEGPQAVVEMGVPQQVQYLLTQDQFQALAEQEQQQYLNDLKMNYYPEQFHEMEYYQQHQPMPLMGEEEFEMIEQQQNPGYYPGYIPVYQMPPPVFEVKKEEKEK